MAISFASPNIKRAKNDPARLLLARDGTVDKTIDEAPVAAFDGLIIPGV